MIPSSLSQRKKSLKPQRKRATFQLFVEQLEDRIALSTFAVLNLNDSGAGSLRQAILDANGAAGADLIDFTVAGTIQLTSGALPAVTDEADINGSTAPGFVETPVVEVDYNGFSGLRFNGGSAGSALRSLGHVNAADTGVTLNGRNMLVAGNFIGLRLDGVTVAGNGGDGLRINASSSGNTIGGTTAQYRNVISGNRGNGIHLRESSYNQIAGNFIGTDVTGTLALGNVENGILLENSNHNLIGNSDPVTGVTYYTADSVDEYVTAWQGIRDSDTSGQYLIGGTSGTNGLMFDGTIAGVGTAYTVNYPGAIATSVYGPDNQDGDIIGGVGIYKNSDFQTASVEVNGFLFQGTVTDLSDSDHYHQMDFPGAKFNYVHSTMGGLAVGNYDNPVDHGTHHLPLGPGHAFLYDIHDPDNIQFLTDIVYPHAKSNTAYGIWYNGDASYTICGGYSFDFVNNLDNQNQPLGHGFLVDYDSMTGKFSNWTSFDYPNGKNFVTHFEGISSVEKGIYTLNADSAQAGTGNPVQGSWVSVRRNTDGSFGKATWVDLNFTGLDPTTNVTSSNSVYGNQVVGVVIGEDVFSYQATVNIGFQLSNVISGNGGNGIALYDSDDNQVAMNYIGPDVTGTLDRGNAQNGILVTDASKRNLIGGEAIGGNDPTSGVFVRPPQGNLISGNNANGMLITGKAKRNQLGGNFVGTDATGNSALGNSHDGVAIVNANNNSLIGCTSVQDPFVYYNVISGNGGNGLRVTNSNNTTIQGNFFGLGADDDTAVGNALNGVVVEGSSANTVFGGVIPLGNVVAANRQNGVVVRDRARGFVSFNTFAGVAAFTDNPSLGNALDGFLITSTGGNNLLRTNVISRNGDDGIEISGAARGVQVVQNIIGLNTAGMSPLGNDDNGVEVGGNAHHIVIGGPQPTYSIIPQNTISANGGHGVGILDSAHDIRVNFSFIGTNISGKAALGNDKAGVFLGDGTYATMVGSTASGFLTVISGNLGDGIEMYGTHGNSVIGSYIGTNAEGSMPISNGDNGVLITNSFNNAIGGTRRGWGNVIAFNLGNGVFVASGSRNGIRQNSIHSNDLLGIDLGPGANNNQAAPVLTSAVTLPGGIRVTGTLTSTPNTRVTIGLFANTTGDPSGFGEGRFYLGSVRVRTNAAGFATFTFVGQLPPDGTSYITATATDPKNNTSEFSQYFILED